MIISIRDARVTTRLDSFGMGVVPSLGKRARQKMQIYNLNLYKLNHNLASFHHNAYLKLIEVVDSCHPKLFKIQKQEQRSDYFIVI